MKHLSDKEKELFTLATDFKNRPGQTKQSITLFKSFIDMLTTINSLREENENLKRMLSDLNKYVMPGETDSGDSARKVYAELRLCKQELLEALKDAASLNVFMTVEEAIPRLFYIKKALEKWDKK